MSIIAIKGIIGSGKDTVAKMIQYYFAKKNLPSGFGIKDMPPLDDFLHGYDEWILMPRFSDSGFEIRKFAYKLKEIAALILNCKIEDLENREFKEQIMPDIYQLNAQNFLFEDDGVQNHTYRWFLQHFADNLKILLGKDYFINELFSHYEVLMDTKGNRFEPNWIISDLRFLNEAKEIKDRNGIIIGLIGRGDETHNHISELELRGIVPDFELDNSGSIENTYELLCKILNSL